MTVSRHDLLKLCVQKVVGQDVGEVTMDGQMMRLLMEVKDGEPIVEAAKRAGLNATQLRESVDKLLAAKLIVPLVQTSASDTLGEGFAQKMNQFLASAVGPMADFLVTKALNEIGVQGKIADVPKAKAAGLVMHLARQIPREEKRVEFQKAMLDMIPK